MCKTETKTINYYNGIAKGYKNLYHQEQINKINLIIKHLPKTGTLLDLGSGDGVLNQFLTETQPPTQTSKKKSIPQKQKSTKQLNLISLDISSKLLKLNKNKNKIQANILNLPIKSNSIDFICSFSVIQDLPDIEKAVFEIKRTLKKNSKAIISFLKISSKYKQICNLIEKNFKILEKNEKNEKDTIYIIINA